MMNFSNGLPIALAAFFSIAGLLEAEEVGYYPENFKLTHSEEEYVDPLNYTYSVNGCTGEVCEPCGGVEESCAEEYWCREICYEPMYYTTQKCIERQIPVKKLCCKMVPKVHEVVRCRYVPEYYTEKVTKNVFEYYYIDDWKTTTTMVSEKQCEWIPKSVWKKVTKETCVAEETQQDD